MFKITIEGDSLNELLANLEAATKTLLLGDAAPKSRGREAATTPPPADASDDAAPSLTADDEPLTGEDALDAPAEPMPEGAKTVVDAGTGQPLPKSSEAIKMTMEDVKVAAAKLAAKDTPALAKILKKYDASKLSEVDKAKLGDFAADVMEALG
jgi:hypothetical protein